jgi:hypothetical protein
MTLLKQTKETYMKLMKRTNTYKGNNVTFNLTTKEAHSYAWWMFAAIVEGKLVFNNYRYSPTTGNHQRKVRRLLSDLGLKIDLEMPLPQGIQRDDSLTEMIVKAEICLCNKYLEDEIKKELRNERAKAKRLANKVTPLEVALS